VEWVVKEGKSQKSPKESFRTKVKIVDVGTGSGCIAIALKKNLPAAEVWACDVSDEALNIARMNADALQAAIDFVPLDFLNKEHQRQLPHVDMIVSNPPYVPEKDKTDMRKNVLDFEPSTALFVPDNDPLVFYSAIADFGKEKLNNGGSIYIEMHENLGEQVKKLFKEKGYHSIELKKDLQGKDRMIKAFDEC
jgi:release factor glutamine methyltransferase